MSWLTRDKIFKLVWLWIGINFIMSLISNLHVSYYYSLPYLDSLPQTMLRAYCISSLAAFLGTYSAYRFYHLCRVRLFPIVVILSVSGALMGVGLSNYLVSSFFSDEQILLGQKTFPFTLTAAIIMSVLVSIIATVIGILSEKNTLYKKQLSERELPKNTGFFVYKNRDQRGKINLSEILYLTADGKRTIVHTTREDIDLSMLLKEVAAQLPPGTFLRTHKKHFVNSTYIKSLKYIRGGVYELYLNDIEESIVPVGRKFLSEIQKLFKDMPANHEISLNNGLNEKQA